MNKYHKYLGKEDMLQHAVMEYVRHQYPHALCVHVPNEGKRSPFMQYKVKYLGIVSGVPDVLIFNPNDKFNGLAIELKWGRNKPTENQKKFIDRLQRVNWCAEWVNTFQDAQNLIDKYFKNEL